MMNDDAVQALWRRMPKTVLATLLRVGRRIGEGFEGEITIAVKGGGISFVRWTQTETGDKLKEELGN